MSNIVVVGKVGAPYGVRGWVKVHSFTEPGENLFSYPLLLEVSQQHGWQALKIEEYKPHKEGFVAKFANVQDRDQAALVTNTKLGVAREDFPELESGEFYWADLLGLMVYNQDNVKLGEIVDFFATGANDVMVVQDGKKEHLIPYALDLFVLQIDLEQKKMLVDWDPEL